MTVSDTLDSYLDAELLAATDLIVQCWTMGTITRDQLEGLTAAVRAGTGFAGWHGGIIDSFRDETRLPADHRRPVRAPPERIRRLHVRPVRTRSRPRPFTVHTEQYYVHIDPAIEVLAVTDFVDGPAPRCRSPGPGTGAMAGCSSRPSATSWTISTCRNDRDDHQGAAMGDALRIGLVGAGHISGQYLKTLPRLTNLVLTPVADLDPAGPRLAAQADVPACTPSELYDAHDVDIVLNLTIPFAHAEVALAAIAAGKHVYGEKPLAADTVAAREIRAGRGDEGRRCASAARRTPCWAPASRPRGPVLDAGDIGVPVAATAFMTTPGHERWHPTPGVLLPARRRPAARHGPVLPDRAGHAARAGAPGGRHVVGAPRRRG